MIEKIIEFLKETDGYVSGEDISDMLKISRTAVWKHIDQLRHDGYEILAVPHLGYKLSQIPDLLLSHEIHHGLDTKIFGRTIHTYETLDSTMDEAFRFATDGAIEGTVVCAETQNKGRGRLGRKWTSPKAKGIYCSVILRPPLSPGRTAPLTLMAAIALVEAVKEIAGANSRIKWPNDLYLDGGKLAGILTEMRAESDAVKFVIVGIGINVNTAKSQLVDGGTSLKAATGQTINRIHLMQALLRRLEHWYLILCSGKSKAIITACKKYSLTLGQKIHFHDGKADVEGMAEDFDSDGSLLIRQSNGRIIKRTAGDIRHPLS